MEYNGFKIENDGTFGYREIKAIGRGSVPMELRGRYTTVPFAKAAIDQYLKENESNGTTKRSSTSK